jgi:hypothetical protein
MLTYSCLTLVQAKQHMRHTVNQTNSLMHVPSVCMISNMHKHSTCIPHATSAYEHNAHHAYLLSFTTINTQNKTGTHRPSFVKQLVHFICTSNQSCTSFASNHSPPISKRLWPLTMSTRSSPRHDFFCEGPPANRSCRANVNPYPGCLQGDEENCRKE